MGVRGLSPPAERSCSIHARAPPRSRRSGRRCSVVFPRRHRGRPNALDDLLFSVARTDAPPAAGNTLRRLTSSTSRVAPTGTRAPHRGRVYRLLPSKSPWRFSAPLRCAACSRHSSPQQLVSVIRCRADILPILLVPLLVPTSPLLVTVLQEVGITHVSYGSHLLAPPVHIQLLCLVRASPHFDTEPLCS